VPTYLLFSSQLRVTGIMVGNAKDQHEMNRAIAANGIKPVIDSSYGLDGIADAFRHQESQTHFGKICLEF
jgi:NADPH:quinone reductase-like Zn-dependent oxidoreductase